MRAIKWFPRAAITRSSIQRQHDLPDVIPGFHPPMRRSRLCQREGAVEHWLQPPRLDMRPYGAVEFVGDQRS